MPPSFSPRATPRDVVAVIDPLTQDDAPVPLRRAFPTPYVDGLDPFLVVERWGPERLAPGDVRRWNPQPHVVCEALTVVRSGRWTTRASRGPVSEVTAGPGDVVRLRGGDGVLYDLSASAGDAGGPVDAIHLWVDVPRRQDGGEPELHVEWADGFPVVPLGDDGSRVRVLAGRFGDVHGPLDLLADVHLLHVTLAPGAALAHPVGGGWRAAAVVVDGFGRFGHGVKGRPAKAGEVVRFHDDGIEVRLAAEAHAGVEVLLLAGYPLRNPVVRYGPFVGRSEDDIKAAMFRYRRGRFGILG